MPSGLQVFDQFGNLKLSLGDRLARLTGLFYTGTGAGSYTISGDNTGEPFFVAVPLYRPADPAGEATFYQNGATISWTFPQGGGGAVFNNINYMVFTGVR